MTVKFENGYVAEMRDEVAKIYIAKGKGKKVSEKPEKQESKPAKPEPKKPEPKDAA